MHPTKESWEAWSTANRVPPIPAAYRGEWERLSDRIRYWSPGYGVGDSVVIRPGTLGNMDGRCLARTVAAFLWCGSHLCVQLEPGDRSSQFAASVYVKA